jgi:hypothetical protein
LIEEPIEPFRLFGAQDRWWAEQGFTPIQRLLMIV